MELKTNIELEFQTPKIMTRRYFRPHWCCRCLPIVFIVFGIIFTFVGVPLFLVSDVTLLSPYEAGFAEFAQTR